MKNANYHIKGYPMGSYKYEWGTQLPWQKSERICATAKGITMAQEEIEYWQKYFIKKYAKKA